MRKIGLLFVFLISLYGCNLDTSDASATLPNSDVSQFYVDNGLLFPEGTSALDLYNCLNKKYGQGTHIINGVYSITQTAILNGKEYKDTVKEKLQSVTLSTSKGDISNRFNVVFSTEKEKKIAYTYEWQYHNTNVWTNTKSQGRIDITF